MQWRNDQWGKSFDIAKRYAIHVRITEECVQVAEPLAPAADQADVDLVIRSHRLGRHADHKGTHSKPGAKDGALLQKLSPCHDMMFYWLSAKGHQNQR